MRKFIYTLFLLFVHIILYGQKPIQFDKIDAQNGLSNNYISHIFEDSDGFIWLATQNGVNRYDGYEFLTLKNSPINANTISANWVMNTTQDWDGNFWFGTFGEGANKLDLQNKTIRRFAKDTANQGFEGAVITKIIPKKNGAIWVQSDEGIYTRSSNQREFKKNVVGKPWSDLCVTEDDKTWIINGDKVFLHNESSNETTLQFNLPEPIVDVRPIGNMLFSCSNTKAYISINKILKKEISLPDKIEFLSNFRNGNIYLASDKKIYEYTIETNTFEFVHKLNQNVSVKSLFVDSKNQLWIGTTHGVLKENKLATELQQTSLLFNARRILYKDNRLLLGGKNGLYIIKGKDVIQKLSNSYITSLYIDHYDNIWAGDFKGNLHQIDSNLNIKTYEIRTKNINKSNVFGIVEDSNERLWLGTWKGIYILNKKGKILHFFRLNNTEENINNKIIQIHADSKGHFWIASSGDGLYKIEDFSSFELNKQIPVIKSYNHKTNIGNTLNSNIIIDIHEDKNGEIWIGTDAGINLYNESEDNFKCLYNNEVLFDQKVMAIEHDVNNRLWISTITNGIFIFDKNNQSFTQYKSNDGLISDEFLFTSSAIDSKGNIYFGSENGVQLINPKIASKTSTPNNPVITSFNIRNGETNSISNISIPNANTVNLRHPHNSFSISFSSLEFSNNSKINYAYKLEGIDETWTFTKNGVNTVHFTNINKGTYIFKVKAYNPLNGFEKGKESSLKIIAIPPWYNSNVAYIGYIILFMGFLFLIFYFRLQQKIAIFKTEQIKRDEEVKLQKLITNFHYLGLSSIFSINDLESIKENQSEIYSILSYFATSLFDKTKIEDVLWDITKNCISKLKLEDCVIYWIDKNRSVLVQKTAYGDKKRDGKNISNPMDIPLGKGIVGNVAITGKSEIVSDLTKDGRYIVDDTPRLSELTVPIFLNNEVVGIIDSEHSKKDFFKKGHLEVFQLISRLLEKKLTQISDKNSTTITNDNIYFKELKQVMEKQKLYTNPIISLVSVAEQLNISPGYLSRLINTLTNGNFNDFINTFRVNEVKRKLKNPEFNNYSILSIGLESGFNSKSVFYTTFKKQTKLSPSEFRKKFNV